MARSIAFERGTFFTLRFPSPLTNSLTHSLTHSLILSGVIFGLAFDGNGSKYFYSTCVALLVIECGLVAKGVLLKAALRRIFESKNKKAVADVLFYEEVRVEGGVESVASRTVWFTHRCHTAIAHIHRC